MDLHINLSVKNVKEYHYFFFWHQKYYGKFFVSTKINTDNHKQIANYINCNKNSNLYGFISKLNYFDLKYISYSNLENNDNFSMSIIFFLYNNNDDICNYCKNRYSVILLKQKYCKYCLMWCKFTKFTSKNMVDIYIITSNNQYTKHDDSRDLDFLHIIFKNGILLWNFIL